MKILILFLLIFSSSVYSENSYVYKNKDGKVLLDSKVDNHVNELKNPSDFKDSLSREIDTLEDESNSELDNGLIKISRTDFLKTGLKPYYTDSIFYYLEESNTHLEVNKIGAVSILIQPEDNYATFGYVENGDTSKSWRVKCIKDKITDKKSCAVTKFAFSILYNGKNTIATVDNDFDKLNYHEKQYIRIDDNKALSTSMFFEGKALDSLVNQMKSGELAYTRFYEWDGEKYEETLSLTGFSEAYKYMFFAYKNLK